MGKNILEGAQIDKAARYVAPEGVQNFSEVREILEQNPAFTTRFISYHADVQGVIAQINDPNVTISKSIAKECQRIDQEQQRLAAEAPDERICVYLVSKGWLLGSKNQQDPHYQEVQDARIKRSLFYYAAQCVHPEGGDAFTDVRMAFMKDVFFTGEFLGYLDASEKFRKEILEKCSPIVEQRFQLLDQLFGELLSRSPHAQIKAFLEQVHATLKALNEKAR